MRTAITLLPVGTRGGSSEFGSGKSPGLSLCNDEAKQSPCMSCASSPCCTYLPVHRFSISEVFDLDYAGYLLGFDGIELGLAPSGEWTVYYRQRCRRLDPQDNSCTLHGTDEQPIVCRYYNPFRCWHKAVLTVPVSDEFVRVDRRRLAYFSDHVLFDSNRRITGSPAWAEIVAAFASMPLEERETPDVETDPALAEWEAATRSGLAVDDSSVTRPRRRYLDWR